MEEIIINILVFLFLYMMYYVSFIMFANRAYKTQIVKAKYTSKVSRSKKTDGYFVRPTMYFSFTTKDGTKEMKEFNCKMKRKGQIVKLIYSSCQKKLIDKVYGIVFASFCFIVQLFLIIGFAKSLGRVYLILTIIVLITTAYFYLDRLDKKS